MVLAASAMVSGRARRPRPGISRLAAFALVAAARGYSRLTAAALAGLTRGSSCPAIRSCALRPRQRTEARRCIHAFQGDMWGGKQGRRVVEGPKDEGKGCPCLAAMETREWGMSPRVRFAYVFVATRLS